MLEIRVKLKLKYSYILYFFFALIRSYSVKVIKVRTVNQLQFECTY